MSGCILLMYMCLQDVVSGPHKDVGPRPFTPLKPSPFTFINSIFLLVLLHYRVFSSLFQPCFSSYSSWCSFVGCQLVLVQVVGWWPKWLWFRSFVEIFSLGSPRHPSLDIYLSSFSTTPPVPLSLTSFEKINKTVPFVSLPQGSITRTTHSISFVWDPGRRVRLTLPKWVLRNLLVHPELKVNTGLVFHWEGVYPYCVLYRWVNKTVVHTIR